MSNDDVEIRGPQTEPSTEPSELTILEIDAMELDLSLTPGQRQVLQSVRAVRQLEKTNNNLQEQNDVLFGKLEKAQNEAKDVRAAKYSSRSGYIETAIATVSMAIGGGLIGSFPVVNGVPTIQGGIGWGLLVSGACFAVLKKPLVALVYLMRKDR